MGLLVHGAATGVVAGAGVIGFGATIDGLMSAGLGLVRDTPCGGGTTASRPAHPIKPAAKTQASRGMATVRRIERAERQEQ